METSDNATALQASPNSPVTVNALNKINAWLLSQQKADGSWGSVADTSIVYLALLGSTSDSGLQSSVKAYLLSQQAADGSWGGDPYVTALVLAYAVGMLSLSLCYSVPTFTILAVATVFLRASIVSPPLLPPRFDFRFLMGIGLASFLFLAAMYTFVRLFVNWAA